MIQLSKQHDISDVGMANIFRKLYIHSCIRAGLLSEESCWW